MTPWLGACRLEVVVSGQLVKCTVRLGWDLHSCARGPYSCLYRNTGRDRCSETGTCWGLHIGRNNRHAETHVCLESISENAEPPQTSIIAGQSDLLLCRGPFRARSADQQHILEHQLPVCHITHCSTGDLQQPVGLLKRRYNHSVYSWGCKFIGDIKAANTGGKDFQCKV